jgi:alpha-D-xyloside xylohydrolase
LFHHADATGHPARPRAWAREFWQSKLRHLHQEELLEVAREYRRLPLSVIVADYFHWTAMGGSMLDPAEYPDPHKPMREFDEFEIRLMVSV